MRGSELRVLGFAARLQNLVKHLDLPAHGVPIEFLDSVFIRADGQVGNEFPVYWLPAFRRIAFLRMDHRQVQRGVALLLANRRQDVNAAVSEFKNRLADAALAVAGLDAVQPLDATSSIASEIVWLPSPARRSTQVRTRKWVPAACAVQNSS